MVSTGPLGTISPSVVAALLRALQESGAPIEPFAALLRDTTRPPLDRAFELFERAPALSGDPDFGVHLGERAVIGDFEVLDHTTRTSGTVAEALRRVCRYYPLLVERIEMKLEVIGDLARIVHRAPAPIVSPRAAIDMLFSAIVTRSRIFTGREVPLVAVRLSYPAPEKTAELERFYGLVPSFSQPADELVFDRAFLDVPLLTADEGVSAALEGYASELVARLGAGSSIAAKVRREIIERLSAGEPDLAPIAKKLALSPRTLQRRLRDEGARFQDLVDDARKDLATTYLADRNLGIQEIAYLLGYSEGSAFHRVFRKWTGQSPADYRAALIRKT